MGHILPRFCYHEKKKEEWGILLINQNIDLFDTPDYLQYGRRTHQEEIPEFLHHVIRYKKHFTAQLQDEILAWKIYDMFIKDGEIQISQPVRVKIQKGLQVDKELKCDLFDEAYKEIIGLKN